MTLLAELKALCEHWGYSVELLDTEPQRQFLRERSAEVEAIIARHESQSAAGFEERYSEFQRLLGEYWEAAYTEGAENRVTDTEDGIANKTLHKLKEVFKDAWNAALESAGKAAGAEFRCFDCGAQLKCIEHIKVKP